MSLFILDTDTLTLLDHDNAVVRAAVDSANEAGHTIGITAVTIEEQITGWFKLFRRAKNHAQLAHASELFSHGVMMWSSFSVFPQTEPSLVRFDALVTLKLNVGKMDLRIASVALELAATIVTHNTRDFARVPGLRIDDWSV